MGRWPNLKFEMHENQGVPCETFTEPAAWALVTMPNKPKMHRYLSSPVKYLFLVLFATSDKNLIFLDFQFRSKSSREIR